ncbi:MAG: hypothetical protein PF440_06945 [Thiomicrorhabdus sp.]|nr:hypothetical protein [Thiomicrorhabdus sp.]
MTCNEALKLEVGDKIYEYGYGLELISYVTMAPDEIDGKVTWKSQDAEGHDYGYMIHREHEHYGPNVYNYPAYGNMWG